MSYAVSGEDHEPRCQESSVGGTCGGPRCRVPSTLDPGSKMLQSDNKATLVADRVERRERPTGPCSAEGSLVGEGSWRVCMRRASSQSDSHNPDGSHSGMLREGSAADRVLCSDTATQVAKKD